ncbi:MAG: superoxide dismutase [Candidatus Magasanikbacteria bacterium RIFCSPHIGHO2_02_FULL_51_14]|uniref:Superoxide dismutase n=1 Tax=Candidatus Magasanikbacteria bacterium RIFCSPHIGHO2_02_FULL_51_14 TaxID=1798683 RepID=A0A1F6MHF9_9BACT|nr:MAG: superoxide dismutase [Candidatus Magasanikbacteria bacterium RIFCSPHIGHO2_02_FULL_51_14]
MKYELRPLPYAYDALEPHIDARTMEIHHTKHHQGYTDNLNKVLEKYPALADEPLESLMARFDTLQMDEADKTAFRNNGGGYLNHNLFWEIMGPAKAVNESLKREIELTFGSFDAFKEQFNKNAISRFGSGWSWLVRNKSAKLEFYSTPNQDSPFLQGATPIIGLDVWEHAYYLKYQNRRAEYVENWWNVLKLL